MSVGFSFTVVSVVTMFQLLPGSTVGLCSSINCADGYRKKFGNEICPGYDMIEGGIGNVTSYAFNQALLCASDYNNASLTQNATLSFRYNDFIECLSDTVNYTVIPFVEDATPNKYCPVSSSSLLSLPSYLNTIQSISNFFIESVIGMENKDTIAINDYSHKNILAFKL